MADPMRLINSLPFRLLVDHVDFMTARAVLRRTVVHAMLPPRRRLALARTVRGHLERCFPRLRRAEWARLTRRFVDHYLYRYAEDCINLGLPSVPRYIDLVARHVRFEGLEHWRAAMARPEGVLLVGSHVGSPALGTAALLTRYLDMAPAERPRTRACADPEAAQYPRVLRRLEEAWEGYQADVRLLYTRRRARDIIAEMDGTLLDGGVVSTNLDVLMGGRSTRPFPLFGRIHVRLPALVAAARTALACGAVVLPWVNLRLPDGFRVVFEPPVGPAQPVSRDRLVETYPALEALCERLRRVLEAWISTWPEQWSYWDRLDRRLVLEVP